MEASDKIMAVDKYVEAFDKGDIEIIRELFADDATVEDPIGSAPHVGKEAIIAFYEKALAAGAKLELTGNPRCGGNAVAFPFNVVIGDTRLEVIDVFEFDDNGKVATMKAYWGQ